MNAGVGAEVAATIQEQAFLRLEAPVKRVAGWATHTGLVFEKIIIPDVTSRSRSSPMKPVSVLTAVQECMTRSKRQSTIRLEQQCEEEKS